MALGLIVLLCLMATPVICFESTRHYTSDAGTELEVQVDSLPEWKLNKKNEITMALYVNEFGYGVSKINEIKFFVKVAFPDKTYEDSAGKWTIEHTYDSAIHFFEIHVSSREVSEGQSATVYYKIECLEHGFERTRLYMENWIIAGTVRIPGEETTPTPEPEPTPTEEPEIPLISYVAAYGCLAFIIAVIVLILYTVTFGRKKSEEDSWGDDRKKSEEDSWRDDIRKLKKVMK